MPTKVNAAWCYMYVHEVVNDSTLDMVLDSVYQIFGTYIENLNIRQIPVSIEDKKMKTRIKNVISVYH